MNARGLPIGKVIGLMLLTTMLVAACQPAVSSAGLSTQAVAPSSGGSLYGSTGASAPAASGSFTLMLSSNATLGQFLVDSKGMTLYIFKKDTPGVSNCSDSCIQNWPALLVTGQPTAEKGINVKLGVITRSDGSTQVTYNDMPLYYFAGDSKPGDANGQGIGGIWFAATP